jgi:hypothetical protein
MQLLKANGTPGCPYMVNLALLSESRFELTLSTETYW